jgi:flagellar basal-body rod protein FlgC
MWPKPFLLLVAAVVTLAIGCDVHRQAPTTLSQKQAFERKRVEVAEENIANINTTRDADGKSNPYRRKVVQWHSDSATWSVVEDPSPFLRRYKPGHPDADSDGYVRYPNVDMTVEALEIQSASLEAERLGANAPSTLKTSSATP